MDGKLWNEKVTLSTLNLDENPYISLLIEIKEDAEYVGGINIFGENYGDYPQGIIMSLIY
jgi:predicted transcriptional regulator